MERIVKPLLLVALILLSIGTWYFSYLSGLVSAYNDSMSHVDIARSIIDGRQPGFAQLGSVWLPLNHVLMLLLVWDNWAWHSGFAGSFFSMVAYVISAIAIFEIIRELTKDFWASVIGASAFALNPNMLYLQTTPLTEPLYLVLFICSVLFFIKFIKTDDLRYLVLLGAMGFFQVLARYDGWFVTFA
ncbi:MAG: glycosyltransferase family 39 protein [Minisyncoccia bacterium]